MRSSFSVAALCIALCGTLPAQSPRPRVLVIGTGGTIGASGDYWGGAASRVPINALARIPGIDSVATIESEQFLNVSSSEIGPSRWLELARRIAELLRTREELRGVVVTHGTDTMEETAYFLDLTVPGERPVIVTGAMRPSNMAGAAGPANLMNAVRAAVDTQSRGRGAMVLMDDRLFAARDVSKTNTTRVETFQAPERGPIAIADPEGMFFRVPSPRRSAPQFDISNVRDLPRVDIIYSYAGADSVLVDAAVAAGARGLVVAGLGRGGVTPAQSAALKRAAAKGVVIVLSSRTGSGRVAIGTTGDTMGAGDLNPQKARVLLVLALTRTSDPARVRSIFAENQ